MNRTATRDELIRVGTEIIAQQGFNTTGLNALLSTAGVPKGSFYYYFRGKEDFGLAVIEEVAKAYARQLDSFLGNEAVSPLQRIRNYLEAGMAALNRCECKRGCLIGNLGQELASRNETFRTRLDAVFRSWKARFARCLEEAKQAGEIPADCDVEQLADLLVTGWEGASLHAKVTRSIAPMQTFIDVLFSNVLQRS